MKKTLLFSLIAFTVIVSCTKISTTEIGTGLIPPIDGIITKDTIIEVNTFNVQTPTPDSIRVSKYSEMTLGYITNDPLMGSTQAIINAEFKPLFFPYVYEVRKDSLFLDSVVLVLGYQGLWGDTANQMKLNVFEISQTSKIKTDSVYPTYASMNTADFLGTATIKPNRLADSVKSFNEAAKNQIRIRLSSNFGNRLLKVYDSTNAYKSDDQFSNTFRGFSIIPESGPNTLLRINLSDTNSKVALYYRYTRRDKDPAQDTPTVKYFRPGIVAGATNNIVRNRTGSESNTYFTNAPSAPDEKLYWQAGPSNYVRINTPMLYGFSNRVIHRAELLMEQEAGDAATDLKFTAPNLFLCAVNPDSLKRFYVPNDIALGQGGTVTNLNAFGGYVVFKNDPLGNRIASYSFNISRYVQGIATKNEKVQDLYLFAPVNDFVYSGDGLNFLFQISSVQFNPPAIGRVRLFGGNSAQKERKMRLRIIYSKL